MKILIPAAVFVLSVSASAQWTVVNLHPAGATESYAYGIGDSQQVGFANFGFIWHAGLWSGTAASWVDLHPAGAVESVAYDVRGGQQVGYAQLGGAVRASLWSGTAGTWTDLNPGVASSGQVFGMSGGQQVGAVVVLPSSLHASLWSGTSASWVDLLPAGSMESRAYAVDGGQQAGGARFGGVDHAGLWTGTAASWVDLNPAGAASSYAFGADSGQQAGYATFGIDEHAGLWTGTAASWVDLHPASAVRSRVNKVRGGRQVGFISMVPGFNRASLWTGTAASLVELHTFLPAGFIASDAQSIWNNGAFTYVVGHGNNNTTGRWEALMWVSRSVAPASFTPVRGIVTGGNLASLLNSDDNRLVIRPGIVFTTGEPPVQIRVDATAPAAFPNGIAFSVESSATFGNAQQRIWLWNYVINDYELVDTRLATMTDDVTNVIVRTNSSRFIQPGTLAIRALVSYKAIGPAFAYPWSARIDKAWWTFPG